LGVNIGRHKALLAVLGKRALRARPVIRGAGLIGRALVAIGPIAISRVAISLVAVTWVALGLIVAPIAVGPVLVWQVGIRIAPVALGWNIGSAAACMR
jgi:hypothetical protein